MTTKPVWEPITIAKALSLCDFDALYVAMNLAFACSLRIGEILGLTWDCVNLSEEALASGNASLFINKELKRCEKSSVEALEKRGRSKVFFTFPEWKRTNCKTMLTKNAENSQQRPHGLPSENRCTGTDRSKETAG